MCITLAQCTDLQIFVFLCVQGITGKGKREREELKLLNTNKNALSKKSFYIFSLCDSSYLKFTIIESSNLAYLFIYIFESLTLICVLPIQLISIRSFWDIIIASIYGRRSTTIPQNGSHSKNSQAALTLINSAFLIYSPSSSVPTALVLVFTEIPSLLFEVLL